MARPKERSVAPQLSQPPIRPNTVAAARTTAYATMSGPNVCHEVCGWCGPMSAIRPSRAAKISGAATALASVPSTMAAQLPAKAARSGRIWRQQYSSVALFDAFGKRVRSPIGLSWWEGQVDGAHRGCAVRAAARGGLARPTGLGPVGGARPESVTGRAKGGPGHAGPPCRTDDGRQDHDGGRGQPWTRRHACHLVTSLPSRRATLSP